MEIRLFDLVNNKVDVRDYMFIHDRKIMVNADYVYKVILDTDKVTLHQQMEMFDSKDEMFKKAKAFDEVKKYVLSKDKDFEDRKDRARSNSEFNYFETLQIANRAIINKCKQVEGE
ncbi:hypothetical protein ACWEWU_14905 [Staphylococcus xylosus]